MVKKMVLRLSKHSPCLPLRQCLQRAPVFLRCASFSLHEKPLLVNRLDNSRRHFNHTTLTAEDFLPRSKDLRRFGRSRCLFLFPKAGTGRTLTGNSRPIHGAQTMCTLQKGAHRSRLAQLKDYRMLSSATERTE